MGCIQKEKSILLISKIKKKDNLDLKYMSPYIIPKNKIIDKITQKNWFQILNFLSFSDLKELGKVNRIFNHYVKQKEILVKFFRRTKSIHTENSSQIKYKKRNSDCNKRNLQYFLSFSLLQKNTNNSIANDDSIINSNRLIISSFKKNSNV
jgi:hypothetical protein